MKNACILAELEELSIILNSKQSLVNWLDHMCNIESQIGCPDLKGEIDEVLIRREATRMCELLKSSYEESIIEAIGSVKFEDKH